MSEKFRNKTPPKSFFGAWGLGNFAVISAVGCGNLKIKVARENLKWKGNIKTAK